MTPTGEEELYVALIVWGGALIVIILSAVVWKLKGSLKRKTIIKELYEAKERKNGQEKGGSRGKF